VLKKKLLFSLLAALIGSYSYSQEETEQKKVNHYIGVQANQLLRQLFSFSSTNTAIDNPYLISYSFNSAETGWGMATGVGYTHNEISEGDPFNPLETTINDFFFRIGIEQKKTIGKKWMVSYGFDVLVDRLSDETVSDSQFGDFTTKTTAKGFGAGLRFSLNFNITDRIILGTDGSAYFKKSKETQEVTDRPDMTEKFKNFSFTVPAVLFVYIKI
jgi:hypothetical protein